MELPPTMPAIFDFGTEVVVGLRWLDIGFVKPSGSPRDEST